MAEGMRVRVGRAVCLLTIAAASAVWAQGGMVPVPSFDTARRPPPPPPPPPPQTQPGEGVPLPPVGGGGRAGGRDQPTTGGDGACRPGPYLEPREYTQPEHLGLPPGERARMCFFRLNGSTAEYLKFFPSGHFYHTSTTGAGGFAMSGAVHGTIRGTYGFAPGGKLLVRTGYQGTSVSQTTRGAGTERNLEVAGQSALEGEMVLSNCQRITYRDEIKQVRYDRGRSHPASLVVNGVKWERYSIDCGDWTGWLSQ